MAAAPRQTSGNAIASFVLGLTAILCTAGVTGIPGLICGFIALSAIKKHPAQLTGRGFAITGLITSALGLALLALILAAAYNARPKPFAVAAPAYTTLIGEDYNGRGFHFTVNGRTYIGCSLHQFDNARPSVMLHDDFTDPVAITGQAHTQTDIQILDFQSDELDRLPPLTYTPNPSIRTGDPVFLIDDSTPIRGHIVRQDVLDDQWIFEPDNGATFEAQARSGSPIVSGLTGDVIGVFLTADDADHATWGGFEPISMP